MSPRRRRTVSQVRGNVMYLLDITLSGRQKCKRQVCRRVAVAQCFKLEDNCDYLLHK